MTSDRKGPGEAATMRWIGTTKPSEIGAELRRARSAFGAVALFSGVVNLLYLSGSLFMMEVYDRVLPSRSVPTLVGLVVIVAMLYGFQGVFDLIRGRLLLRIADRLDRSLAPRIYDAVVDLQVRAPATARANQPIRDLDAIRSFLSGGGPAALFDLPWMPFYLAVCFAFHFWIGVTALAGAVVLSVLTAIGEFASRRTMREATGQALARNRLIEASRANAEVIAVMGMTPRLRSRWLDASRGLAAANVSAGDTTGGLGVLSKVVRMMLQSGVLAVGAWLVINDQATGGIIIAGSILSARALAPVDQAIANWKGFVAARQARTRLDAVFARLGQLPERMPLPAPSQGIALEGVAAVAPDTPTVVLADVTFSLAAGSGLGVIGPSASGKSSLARLIAGAWQPARGTVRLDGATLDQWPRAQLATHIGYMPQATALIEGTVAENIASFAPDAEPDAIVAAARLAGIHEMILALPQGYNTRVEEGHSVLSAGQQQRIALARALYGDPFLVILDEPNSNLDATGEEALTRSILEVRARGGIVIVVAHRPSALAGVDHVAVLSRGRIHAFGPKEEVLSTVMRPVGVPVRPRAATEGDAS